MIHISHSSINILYAKNISLVLFSCAHFLNATSFICIYIPSMFPFIIYMKVAIFDAMFRRDGIHLRLNVLKLPKIFPVYTF